MTTDKTQMKTTTSLVWRVVRRGVRGCRMLTYLGITQNSLLALFLISSSYLSMLMATRVKELL